MEIVISIETLDPPAGQVRLVPPAAPGPGVADHTRCAGFTGWLGLLRALDDMIGRGSPPSDGA